MAFFNLTAKTRTSAAESRVTMVLFSDHVITSDQDKLDNTCKHRSGMLPKPPD